METDIALLHSQGPDSISRAMWITSTSSCSIYLRYILVLYLYLSINPPNVYYPSGKIYELYIFFMPSTGAVSPVILFWLHS
jgi:hypothetical protein